MNKTVKQILLVVLAILLLTAIGIGIYYFVQKSKNKLNYELSIEDGGDVIAQQVDIDKAIEQYVNDESISINKPVILQNPYAISPLTALIIFHTNNNVSYDVYLNDQLMTKTESSKQHSIPIYGLVAGKNNIIKLRGSDNSNKEISIENNSNNYPVTVDQSSKENNGFYYFFSSIDQPNCFAINSKGETVWYLNNLGGQDIEFLANGHLLVSNQSSSGLNSFTGFYEIDYFGKIYKSYSLKNNYHHEVNELSDGNYIVAGEKVDSKFKESYVYIINRDSGEEISHLDLYDLFASIDEAYTKSLGNKDLINNSIDYNQDTKEIILSLRGLNSVISLNYDTKQINWILGNKDNFSEKFNKYILKSADGSRLPLGQHSAFITQDGYLALLNNDYDVTKENKTALKSYSSNYSSASYYEINKSNMTYKTVWNYIDEDKVFNYALSSFNISKDKHKIINFGWSFEKNAYQKNTTIFDETHITYSRIVDLNENNNIVFRAKIKSNIYRAYKNKFYFDSTNNYVPGKIVLINTYDQSVLKEVPTLTIQGDINKANDKKYDVDFTNDSININMYMDELYDIKLVFKSDAISYIYDYKPANQPVNNRINLKIKGSYEVFLVKDGEYYKTDTFINTDNKTMMINNGTKKTIIDTDDEE